MPDFEGNYFEPTPENLQKRREVEQRVLAGYLEAMKDLDKQCREAFGIPADASQEETVAHMLKIADDISSQPVEMDDGEVVFTVSLKGRPLFRHTMPRLVMEGVAKGSVQYRFKKLEDNGDEE